MELYYWEDLSLGEIAQDVGITRQAVRDSIKRSEQLLNDFEEKLGIAEKIIRCRDNYSQIINLAATLKNVAQKDDIDKIQELAIKGSEIF